MAQKIKLAFIGPESPWFVEQTQNHIEISQFNTVLDINGEFDGIVLNPEITSQQLIWLKVLRGNSKYSSLLILSLMDQDLMDSESKILVDSTWQSLDQELKNIRNHQQQMANFNYGNFDPIFFEVLRYLWADEKRTLQPFADWQSPKTYRYPILSCFSKNEDDELLLLERLRNQSIIKHTSLIDRLRCCPDCKRSHLNFVDVCPSCKSLDIEQQKSLHCFNCGFVGSEIKFQKNGTLVCPNCETRLRHIGSDYDRPFEQIHCKKCSELFIDPEVLSRCMQCGKTSSPDQLQLEIIYIYQLGEKGREICRHGVEIEDLSKLMDSALIPAEVFMYSAKWLDHLSIRNEDQPFSIVAIKIKNVATLIEQKGYAEAHETMQALSERIREMIRCSDLIMRRSDELYFILLPSTPIEGVLILREKIAKALLSIQLDKGAYIEVKTDSFSSSVRDGNQLYDIENILNDLSNAVTE